MSPPPSMSAVTLTINGTAWSLLFYVTPNNTIRYLYQQDNQISKSYQEGSISVNGQTMAPLTVPVICAIDFQNSQLRIYYIGTMANDTTQYILKEYVSNGTPDLTSGKIDFIQGWLDNGTFTVNKDSRLQASVSSSGNDIKLFYQRTSTDQPYCVYVQSPQTATSPTWVSFLAADSW